MLRPFFIASAVVAVGGGAGCTALVLVDDSEAAACASDDDCGAGTLCVDAVCTRAQRDSVPSENVLIDGDGGSVTGPDGVTLVVEAGAVEDLFAFSIERASATLAFNNFAPRSPFYAVTPVVDFAVASTLAVPGGCDGDDAGCALFLRPVDGGAVWERAEVDAVGGFAAEVSRTNIFALGVALDVDTEGEGEGEGGGQ